jgi:hypothetical protein
VFPFLLCLLVSAVVEIMLSALFGGSGRPQPRNSVGVQALNSRLYGSYLHGWNQLRLLHSARVGRVTMLEWSEVRCRLLSAQWNSLGDRGLHDPGADSWDAQSPHPMSMSTDIHHLHHRVSAMLPPGTRPLATFTQQTREPDHS